MRLNEKNLAIAWKDAIIRFTSVWELLFFIILPVIFKFLLASALAAAAFGTTMGTFIKTEGQSSGLSIMLGMVFAMMGGCWYPLELFPPAVQNAVKVLPTTWAMQGMLDLGLRGGGLQDVVPEAAVLLGFAVIFFSLGAWRFRYE